MGLPSRSVLCRWMLRMSLEVNRVRRSRPSATSFAYFPIGPAAGVTIAIGSPRLVTVIDSPRSANAKNALGLRENSRTDTSLIFATSPGHIMYVHDRTMLM